MSNNLVAVFGQQSNQVRVRFAPSPTGHLHIGGARTGIFNWIFAKKTCGVFILRIEDTDEFRSTEESVNGIIESLKWLGLNWDEGVEVGGEYGPYFQMQRLNIYKEYAEKLLKSGNAYYCFCSPEELEAMRKEQLLRKQPPKYNSKCRNLTEKQIKEKIESGIKPAIRFKMPEEGKTIFNDIIRGELVFENRFLDDFVILKASGIPTYNFACVVDDYLMKITHVIRGDDHISNTPRQIQLYNALGLQKNIPEFAHLSMILGPDGTRLSKRHGATSVLEYKNQGYLSEALFNYLVLSRWSTEDSQQIFDPKDNWKELIEKFSLEKCSKSPAIFDPQKLLWMNSEYIRKTPVEKIVQMSSFDISDEKKYNLIRNAVSLEHEKIKLLSDIPYLIEFFLKDDIKYQQKAIDKVFKKDPEKTKKILSDIYKKFNVLKEFTRHETERVCREYASEKGLKTSEVFHSIRVAVSGRTEGPGLFEMLELLDKEKVLKRISYVIKNFL